MPGEVIPPNGTPCQGKTSKGPCSCEGWARKPGTQGQYVICAGCGMTAQIHYVPSEQTMKVKR